MRVGVSRRSEPLQVVGEQYLPFLLLTLTMLESIELLAAKALDARCESKMQKVGRPAPESTFRVPMRVGRMNVALDHLVVHQPINVIGGHFKFLVSPICT